MVSVIEGLHCNCKPMTGLMLLGPFVCEVGLRTPRTPPAYGPDFVCEVGLGTRCTIATVPDRFGNLWLNQQEKEECRLGVVRL